MSDPTNLSQKFAALQDQMTIQYMDLKTAIESLRGVGPENTLRSVNQSLWNLAGAAPGVTLADLKTLLTAMKAQWDGGAGLSAYSMTENMYLATVDLLRQFDTSTVTPTMKDLLMTISDLQAQMVKNTNSPLSVSPVGICETPFTSTGTVHISITAQLIESATVATWPETVPSGFNITSEPGEFATGQTITYCADWSQYRIYVASNATQFGVIGYALQRFNTNKWIYLSGDYRFEYFVNGNESLKVYICPVGGGASTGLNDAPSGGCGAAWVRQIGWEYVGIYSFYDSVVNDFVLRKVYTPVFSTGTPLDFANYTLNFSPNADNTRYIIGINTQMANICIGWNTTGRSSQPYDILTRARLLGNEFFLSIGDEPWRGSFSILGSEPTGSYPWNVVNNGLLPFYADDHPLEIIVIYDVSAPAPTELDLFISVCDVALG